MRKQKFRLNLIGLVAILITSITPTPVAHASDNKWVYDEDQILMVTHLYVNDDFLDGLMNMTRTENLGVSKMCFFTYDENATTQSQVEANLSDFQNNPDWIKNIACFDYTPVKHHTMVLASDFSRDKMFSNNRNGILYYVMDVKWWDLGEQYWVWGKVDYRRCAYNPENELSLDGVCDLVDKSKPAEWARYKGNLTPYVSWSDEWAQILTSRIDDIEIEVEAWVGDNDEKESIVSKLQDIKSLTSDATSASELDLKIQELMSRLEQKANDIAEPENPQEPEPDNPQEPEPENPQEPEPDNKDDDVTDPKEDSDPDNSKDENSQTNTTGNDENKLNPKPVSTPSHIAASSATAPTEEISAGIKDNNSTNIGTIIGNVGHSPTQIMAIASEVANDLDDVRKKDDATEGESLQNPDSTGIEVPDLREDELVEQADFWSFWWIIVIILALGGALWWCIRAFSGAGYRRK